ncbi:MAG: hypothetical protein DCC65_07800 [Planctomycetota bacterium]|nr:MAG: hypothetical protein DCC65_07800 [Planctomycetota bacterium]
MIAYLLPGFIGLVGISTVSPAISAWLATSSDGQPTVGGFLYVTIASLALGMFASGLRWLVIDTVHHKSGIRAPNWDFAQLQSNLAAYDLLVEFHYRHYQFYANSFVVIALNYFVRLAGGCQICGGPGWVDAGFLFVEVVLFATSRDTLRKYYARVSHILAASAKSRKEKHHGKRRQPSQRYKESEDSEIQRETSNPDKAGATGSSSEQPDGEE